MKNLGEKCSSLDDICLRDDHKRELASKLLRVLERVPRGYDFVAVIAKGSGEVLSDFAHNLGYRVSLLNFLQNN